ncbi:hypothetical protein [Aliterella atlantica]|uniref:Uncharacterized protein n=1 Tax=Aliterella atlantica CENA595 TaxID=1618023 RepID=A0A0D9A050_9CYAN|nr:hypothetical protein [Aliterella atlantica]KJH72836.1 hypothetical protein UH38_04600 [Aliterella atlantica CENA595]
MLDNVEQNDVVDSDKNLLPKHNKLVGTQSEVEKAKAWIVKALIIIFGSTIGCCFVLVALEIIFPSSNKETLKDIVTSILFAETVILGTVLGFYFGDRSKH